MKANSEVTQSDFDALLAWLGRDTDDAGAEYEQIRLGLERYFRFRGCNDAMSLADETINRVAFKIDSLDLTKKVKKISVFYGFASNVYKEYVRTGQAREYQLKTEIELTGRTDPPDDAISNGNSKEFDCLEQCLDAMTADERKLVIGYYSEDKGAKIEIRKKLAKKFKMRKSTLRVKMHRIRDGLRKCVTRCVNKKTA